MTNKPGFWRRLGDVALSLLEAWGKRKISKADRKSGRHSVTSAGAPRMDQDVEDYVRGRRRK